jgi:hypothetical protein
MFPGDNRKPMATTLRCVELHCILSKAAAAIAPAPSNAALAMSPAGGGGSGRRVRVDNLKMIGFPYHKRHCPPRRLACLLEPEGQSEHVGAQHAGNFHHRHALNHATESSVS